MIMNSLYLPCGLAYGMLTVVCKTGGPMTTANRHVAKIIQTSGNSEITDSPSLSLDVTLHHHRSRCHRDPQPDVNGPRAKNPGDARPHGLIIQAKCGRFQFCQNTLYTPIFSANTFESRQNQAPRPVGRPTAQVAATNLYRVACPSDLVAVESARRHAGLR